jgi:hypothetical protein
LLPLKTFTVVACLFALFISCTKPGVRTKETANSATEDAHIKGPIPDGTYKISPAGNMEKAIVLTMQSVDDSIGTELKTFIKDSTGDLWHFTNTGNNFYRISSAYSGKVLTASSAVDGAPLLQMRYDTSSTQLWEVKVFPRGVYKFFNKGTGLCINRETDGTITTRKSATAAVQFWQLSSKEAIYVDVDATGFFRRTSGWVAGDGASSILMNDGRVAWFFGDSHIDDYFSSVDKIYCLFQVRNAAMVQPANHTWNWKQTDTYTGNTFPGTQSYFKNKASDDYWMWPARGFQLKGNDTVYVYNSPLKKTGNGQWDFAADSFPLWGKIHSPDMKVVDYTLLQDFDDIDFGQGFIQENDGYIYAYGSRQTFIVADVFVARFPASNPNAPWMFYTGSGWSYDIKDIKRINESATSSVNVCKYNNRYFIFSTEFSLNCDIGTHIYASVGDSPTGPFTQRQPVYSIPDRFQGHSPLFYVPNAHPELSSASELLLTYNINGYGDCINLCKGGKMDPDHYRPRAIRIPFSMLNR